jgi:hypothetical protein
MPAEMAGPFFAIQDDKIGIVRCGALEDHAGGTGGG